MPDIKVKLLRPLDGHKEGAVRTFNKADADRLEGYGAVRILGPAKAPRVRVKKAGAEAKVAKPSAAQRRKAVDAAPRNQAQGRAPSNKAIIDLDNK